MLRQKKQMTEPTVMTGVGPIAPAVGGKVLKSHSDLAVNSIS